MSRGDICVIFFSKSSIKPSTYEENILYFFNILNMREEQNTKLGQSISLIKLFGKKRQTTAIDLILLSKV